MREFLRALGSWFFARGDPRTAALLRIAFCGLYLLVLWDFYPAMPLLFGHSGLFGTLEPFPYDLSSPRLLLFNHDSPLELQIWFWSSVAVTVFAFLGFATRITVPLTFASMVLFQERDPFMIFGADLVMRCVGFWLLFLSCGRVWSLDWWMLRSRGNVGASEIELWPVKAIQIQVALVYLVTGLVKWNTAAWQEGSAVYYALQVGNVFKGHAPSWVMNHRELLAAMNYGTLVLECSIPFMMFYRPLRVWAVAAAVLLHTGIDLFMSIRFFSPAMYVGFLSLIDDKDWNGWLARFAAVRGRTIKREQESAVMGTTLEG